MIETSDPYVDLEPKSFHYIKKGTAKQTAAVPINLPALNLQTVQQHFNDFVQFLTEYHGPTNVMSGISVMGHLYAAHQEKEFLGENDINLPVPQFTGMFKKSFPEGL